MDRDATGGDQPAPASDDTRPVDDRADLGDAEPAASAPCRDYCDAIARTCATNRQYDSTATCLAYCRFMPEGSATTANTLACRAEALRRFEPARPTSSCLAAGPGGEPGHSHSCGSACATFCAMALRICPGVFADADACMSGCAAFPDRPVYGVPTPDRHSFACRLHYLTEAAVRPDVHCAKIGPDSQTCRSW